MDSWLIILLLLVMLIICLAIHARFLWNIKKMAEQLERIIENFGTNELVRTNIQSKPMNLLVTKINWLIHLFKQDQQRKERQERELKQEITNISHDLRTPLTSIKGFSELLEEKNLSTEEKEESLTVIQKKIDSLTVMVDSFYELSQINSSDSQLLKEKLFLDQVLVESMLTFYEDFESSNLDIAVDEGNVPPVSGDLKATQRIIINIIQNSLRYAKSYVTIHLFEQDGVVLLRAANDVHEFDENELLRIFDRSFSGDFSRSDGQLGLGLHIVQRLTQKQEGKVDAHIHENEFQIDVQFKKWHLQ